MKQSTYILPEDFCLESGGNLESPTMVYHTAGELNYARNNVVWVFHALTANSNVFEWWPGLFGEDDYFNPNDHFIICVNTLGSPYGSTRPNDLHFPIFTVRDVVKLQLRLAEHLKISHIQTLIGGSFGGYQAIEFAYSFNGNIEQFISIGSSAAITPWSIAIHESQRLALQADSTFGILDGGQAGLKAARAIGMLTYRTAESLNQSQADAPENWNSHKVASYINYQGNKLVNRFDALAYFYLTSCLDSHNVGRGRGGLSKALSKLKMNTLVISIDTDQLELPAYQAEMSKHIPHSTHITIHSEWGHDGFLIETESIAKTIETFRNQHHD